MAQHDYVIANGTGAAVRSDLNNGLAAIVSNNSGATEPATMYAYQWWADTTTGLLKLRNSANSAWISLRELDGTLTIEDGTAAAPGLAFTSDLNTGLLRVGADQVAISTGGTSRLAVSTTAVSSTLAVDVPLGAVATPSLTFTGDLNTGIWSPAADTIAFSEGGAEAMRIDSSSRLLVGTSSDLASYNLQVANTSGNGIAAMSYSSTGGDGAYITLYHSKSGTVGTHSTLGVDDDLGIIQFSGSNGTAFWPGASIKAEVDAAISGSEMPGRLVFSTTADGGSSPTERMRISSGGEIDMYNSTTDWSLSLNTTNANPFGLRVNYGSGVTPNNTGNEFLYCDDSTALRFAVRSNGGINNYSANNVNLSDINAKKDITLAAGTWDCIKEWEIVNYRYKDQPDDADLTLGVVAQQVAESCPEVITIFQEAKEATEDKPAQEERLGVKEQQMYWMAIKALQEAQVRIETLEASNTDLLARVTALEAA